MGKVAGWGGCIMISGALSRSWPFVRARREFCLPVNEAGYKLVLVLLLECFLNPVFWGAVVIDGDLRYVCEKEA